MARTFEDKPATRERTPLLVGLIGPSGTGKTYSALRLATGIQRVSGGDIFVIDTEARRSLHYAKEFKFRHVAFGAPFAPLDYLAAIEHCVKKGAGTIIVDSMSHEHEGPGGLLEMHEAETARMSGGDWKKADRVKMLAWQKPKAQRRRLINSMLQLPCNFILCFRAKQKLKLVKGEEPTQLGYMPIAGEEFVYEMVLKCLFLPGADGVPVLRSEFEGERSMIKVPSQFRGMFDPGRPRQLCEDDGESLAKWAAGEETQDTSVDELMSSYKACSDHATYRTLEEHRKRLWARASKDEKVALKKAADETKEALDADIAAMADEHGEVPMSAYESEEANG